MKLTRRSAASTLVLGAAALVAACTNTDLIEPPVETAEATPVVDIAAPVESAEATAQIDPANWPVVETPPLDPEVEARIDSLYGSPADPMTPDAHLDKFRRCVAFGFGASRPELENTLIDLTENLEAVPDVSVLSRLAAGLEI